MIIKLVLVKNNIYLGLLLFRVILKRFFYMLSSRCKVVYLLFVPRILNLTLYLAISKINKVFTRAVFGKPLWSRCVFVGRINSAAGLVIYTNPPRH